MTTEKKCGRQILCKKVAKDRFLVKFSQCALLLSGAEVRMFLSLVEEAIADTSECGA
jgi:hypothetical protein